MTTAPSSAKNIKKLCKEKLRQFEKQHATTLSFNGMGLISAELFPKYKFVSTLTRLDLTGNRLRFLPTKFSRLENLLELNLSHNLLEDVPPVVFTLVNLDILNLERNQLQFIPTEIERLRKLTTLGLAHNRLRTLPNEMTKLLRLKKLTLVGNQVPEYYEKIFSLLRMGFDNINLSNMRIARLPNLAVEMAGQLRILNLAHNNMQVLSPEIFFLTQLRVLEMRNNKLQTLSTEIGKLNFLEVLGLAQNSLSEVPETVTCLSHLSSVNLTHNYFKEIPSALLSCPSLVELYLGHNAGIESIPDSLRNLSSLQILALPGNQISDFPTELFLSMSSLRSINLSRNPIHLLPLQDEFLNAYAPPCGSRPSGEETKKQAELNLQHTLLSPVLLHLVHVRNHSTLDLSGLQLDEFPPELDRYAHLVERFTLADNAFACFPPQMKQFTALQRLVFSGNSLDSLPDDMAQYLPQLVHLDCSQNEFREVPAVVSSLVGLQFLSFSGNHVVCVPSWLESMSSLRTLGLASNMLTEFPSHLSPTLTDLDLSRNKLLELPENLVTRLGALVALNVERNSLTSVPFALQDLEHLRKLNISRNQLSVLPLSFIQWCQEENRSLIGSGNPFTSTSVGRVCEYLESLTLPAVMNAFNEVVPRTLDLSRCRLEQTPLEMESLQHLLSVSLSHNRFTSLDTLPCHQLCELTTLEVDGNELCDLPESFSQLCSLTHLSLAHNCFRTFPSALLHLSSLVVLNISHNQLENLPESLGEQQTLQEFNVASNQLRFFPECLYYLPRLQVIHIENNQIRTIGLRVNMEWTLMRQLCLWGNSVDVEVLRRKFPQLEIVCEEPHGRSNRCSSDGLVTTLLNEQDTISDSPSDVKPDSISKGRSRTAYRNFRDIPMMKSGSVPSVHSLDPSLPSQV